MKRLIFEAYQVPYSGIAGGPGWLDSDEYDIDAKAERPASLEQLRLMLRTLLADRFKLVFHRETKERPVYALVVAKGGPKLRAAKAGESSPDDQRSSAGMQRFHCDLTEFADRLAILLTIPVVEDPATPSRARGAPVPVLNKTGMEGIYDISVNIRPDPGADAFTFWQRALEEQLGLKLEAQKAPVEVIVIDQAERVPTAN